MELFERLAYYGQQIVFMIYLRNRLGFSESEAGSLSGIFGGVIYLLPILAGTLADKWDSAARSPLPSRSSLSGIS